MIHLRRLLWIAGGKSSAATWLAAARQEERVAGPPRACAVCPLRPGGEWEAGAVAALAEMTARDVPLMRLWGCHESARPCDGMRRLLATREREARDAD